MYTILTVFQVLLAAAMVAVILVQRGAGATMGAAFGSGASGTVFGSRGAGGFLSALTVWLGVAFFALSLGMAVYVARSGDVRCADGKSVHGAAVPGREVYGRDDRFAENAPARPLQRNGFERKQRHGAHDRIPRGRHREPVWLALSHR